MSTSSNIRVSELAKELGLTSKDVIAKLAEIQIIVKTHSSSVTPDQCKRLKDYISGGEKKETKKPKAFIVKKSKVDTKPEVTVLEKEEPVKKSEPAKPLIERVERKVTVAPKRIETVAKVQKPIQNTENNSVKSESAKEVKKEDAPSVDTPVKRPATPAATPVVPRVPVVRRVITPVNRLEIVRHSANRTENTTDASKVSTGSKPVKSRPAKPVSTGMPTPIERHIIPQNIYENKNQNSKHKAADSRRKDKISKEEEQEMISLEKAAAQKHKKHVHKEVEGETITSIVVNTAMTIGELADKIKKTPADIVKFLMLNGIMATVNELIDVDVIKKVCNEYGLEVLDEDLEAYVKEEMKKEELKEQLKADEKNMVKRAPVISIMGHVDHGKTTLLDSIRASKHKIVNTEVGGITQSIGAYTIYLDDGRKVVFLDTPGHEAFTAMRARGAKATDIAILVVAADDGIMPQTVEAINHAKAAEIPIIVAVNKIDKAGADPDRVLTQLTEHGLVPEAWGGDTITCKVSALQRTGIDELLEYILLVADMEDLKANPNAKATGVVIEANLDKGKGPVATLLVQNGTLRTGNCVIVGTACGRVRALLSDSGEKINEAEPSTPVEILGLTEVPQAGENFEVVANEKEMKAIIAERQETERTKRLDEMLPAHIRKDAVSSENDVPNLNLIIKANTHGAAEAVSQAIAQMDSDEIDTKIIHVGVGDISEADVMLASASNALILGFTVKEDSNAMAAAEREHVKIKKYDIIYQILEDMEKTMLSLLEPEIKEVALGTAEVRQIFTIGKTTKIAGCYVTDGKIQRGKTAIVKRNGAEVFKGTIDQLKRFKDDVKEVAQGFECGISFAKFNDLQEGDIIEVSTTEEVERQKL